MVDYSAVRPIRLHHGGVFAAINALTASTDNAGQKKGTQLNFIDAMLCQIVLF
jgi:hypothetical protein